MNTVYRVLSHITCLIFLTGFFLLPIGDIAAQEDPDYSGVVIEESKEVPLQRIWINF